MKIKKTFQGELPENRVVNAKSNSATDAYSANYLNDKLRNVVVSPTEPTTGEDVWIKRSSNILKFDDFTKTVNGITFTMKDQVLHVEGTATAYTQECYLPINLTLEEAMTLTVDWDDDNLVPKASYTYNGTSYYPNLYSQELEPGTYLNQLYFIIASGATVNTDVKFQLERGRGFSGWQPVMEKAILVKNDNDVYEDLIKKSIHVGINKPKNGEEIWVQKSRNLFDIRMISALTENGLTMTPNVNNNTLHIEGTPTGYLNFVLMDKFVPEHDFIVSLNGKMNNTKNMMLEVLLYKDGNYVNSVNADYRIGLDEYDFDYCVIALKRNNNVATNEDIQVLVSYVDDPTYEPYVDPKVYIKTGGNAYEEFYDDDNFLKVTNITKQKVNSTQGSWQSIPTDPNHRFLVSVIVGSNNSDVKTIPISLIKKYSPSDPIKIIVNGTTITQLAWSGGTIVEYIWTSGYKVEHYSY